jgi:hypothetical protein
MPENRRSRKKERPKPLYLSTAYAPEGLRGASELKSLKALRLVKAIELKGYRAERLCGYSGLEARWKT